LLSSEREVDLIQETIFLSDKDSSNCTVILLDKHRYLAAWLDQVDAWELASDDYIHRITHRMYSKNNVFDNLPVVIMIRVFIKY
jgi:hypothetical protein